MDRLFTSSNNTSSPNPSGFSGRGVRGFEDLTSLWALFTSFSSFSDWTKIFVLGGLLETLRRYFWRAWNYLVSLFFLRAQLEATETSYQWMLVWLSNRKTWSTSRNVLITAPPGDSAKKQRAGRVMNRVAHDNSKHDRSISFQPMYGTTCGFWYGRAYVQIARIRNVHSGTEANFGAGVIQALSFRIYGGSHATLRKIVEEARDAYKSEVENRIRIWTSHDARMQGFTTSIVRPKRSLSSVVLDRDIKNLLIEDAKDFLNSESWYAERGIPWRRGYLLHGCPGSGKTSLIHAIAGELDLDIYVISLSKRDMDDAELNKLISSLPARSIALMEDIDAAFTQGVNREPHKVLEPPPPSTPMSPTIRGFGGGRMMASQMATQMHSSSPGYVTLAGLLGAIDGVAAQEGRILFATTNHYKALDPALRRPGRLDVHLEFKLASSQQAEELFTKFYPANRVGEVQDKPLIDFGNEKPAATVDLNIGTYNLSEAQLSALAKEFASKIPEHELSMASLQGHLMRYKTRPYLAVSETTAWVESERSQKKEWEGSGDNVAANKPESEDKPA